MININLENDYLSSLKHTIFVNIIILATLITYWIFDIIFIYTIVN